MTEAIKIRLPKAKNTTSAGASLSSSIYTVPLTIFLRGDIGVGKTTFLQGFAEGLGIQKRLTSPTYALEQRYQISSHDGSTSPCLPAVALTKAGGGGLRMGGFVWSATNECVLSPSPLSPPSREGYTSPSPAGIGGVMELLHIDLYRIDPKEAKELVESSDDFEGIRCIEWSEKISEQKKTGPHIDLLFKDIKNSERNLCIQFHDISLPSRTQIETWRRQVMLPDQIRKHCDIVGEFAEKIARALLENGIVARPLALRRAGELHDLLRFLDFQNPPLYPPPVWKKWMAQYPNFRHEAACALFLREQGFNPLAAIIEPHGLMLHSPKRSTIEQKVLFYADKRVIDRVVSIDERFEDFKNRYGNETVSAKHTQLHQEVRAIERELFPDGAPF